MGGVNGRCEWEVCMAACYGRGGVHAMTGRHMEGRLVVGPFDEEALPCSNGHTETLNT